MLARMFLVRPADADRMEREIFVKCTALLIGVAATVSLLITRSVGVDLPIMLVAGFAFALAHQGYVRLAGGLLAGTIQISILITLSTGMDRAATESLSPFIVPILLAGLVLGSNAVLLFGAVSLGLIGVTLAVQGVPFTTEILGSLIMLLISTALTWLIMATWERAVLRAQHQTTAALAAQTELQAQQATLAATNQELRSANDQMAGLLDLVRDLETPVIPLLDGVLVMPLIGHIDTRRATQLTDSLLTTIHRQRAHTVIIDITGVSVVDTAVAQRLSQLAQAAQLLGAHVMMTGMRAEIAQTIVKQGIDFSRIQTAGHLQDGIATVLASLGTESKSLAIA